jgi:hypothetical protein|tara:strand:- start:273 stop:392 length:120 start_codon:yes stop_codon:yes gene_type:complete
VFQEESIAGPGINDGSTGTITDGLKVIVSGRKRNVLTIK